MDSFVKNFILMSIVYLALGAALGMVMLCKGNPALVFVHAHLMLLGWVSMMIYGVGYHILPRFAGRLLKSRRAAVLQFWTANAGLVGMLGFYLGSVYDPGAAAWKTLTAASGAVEVFSIALFFCNMAATLYSKPPA